MIRLSIPLGFLKNVISQIQLTNYLNQLEDLSQEDAKIQHQYNQNQKQLYGSIINQLFCVSAPKKRRRRKK